MLPPPALAPERANLKRAGAAQDDAHSVIGTVAISGGATITLKYAGKNLGKADRVYLVE